MQQQQQQFSLALVLSRAVKPRDVRRSVSDWIERRARSERICVRMYGSKISIEDGTVSIVGPTNTHASFQQIKEAEASLADFLVEQFGVR